MNFLSKFAKILRKDTAERVDHEASAIAAMLEKMAALNASAEGRLGYGALTSTERRPEVSAASNLADYIFSSRSIPDHRDLLIYLIDHDVIQRYLPNASLVDPDPAKIAMTVLNEIAVIVADDLPSYEAVDKARARARASLADYPPREPGSLSHDPLVIAALRDSVIRNQRRSQADPDFDVRHLDAEEIRTAAAKAEETIEHTLARLFLRLGPPPESTGLNFSPVESGGGGARQ
ncbi:hypothetical protein IM697_10605 [Streptomyces ferrugineus]|uniref:Uncharacterized protein n=1 Tax=Streptomyces ferrugineus TaxID=1413221 RepID=A0A7M2SU07_9ACTN|nr:hypothetical protein [Streptomyces ferrugineus]QOV38781.1 hypothetical protein IM697_10605 [Streptomyces ferrugineus]